MNDQQEEIQQRLEARQEAMRLRWSKMLRVDEEVSGGEPEK